MPAFIDWTGERLDRLLVIERAKTRGRVTYWKCRCDCGREIEIQASELSRNKRNFGDKITRSCGCYKRDMMTNNSGDAPLNRLIMYFKEGAKRRNLVFELDKEYVRNLTSSPCFYCGNAPSQVFRRSIKYNYEYLYNGIDRVDNTKGYVIDNVVSCCGICNHAKNTMTIFEFRELISNIYNHWISPNKEQVFHW